MKTYTFTYDLERKDLQENDSVFANEPNIQNANIIPAVTCRYERESEMWTKVWCRKHKAYEEIESYNKDGVITKTGCSLEGIAVPMDSYVRQTQYAYVNLPSSVTARIQVRHNPEEGTIFVDENSVTFIFTWEKDKISGEFVLVPSLSEYRSDRKEFDITNDKPSNYDVPSGVLPRLVDALREDFSKKYGYAPKTLPLPADKSGYNAANKEELSQLWLNAFLNRPLDMNIYFFRKYFKNSKEYDFDALFPRDKKDNFETLAKIFDLEPAEELKNLYETNPLGIILRMMLPEFGVKSEELLKKFDSLQSFCGKTMAQNCFDNLFFDPLQRKNEGSPEFENLKFYTNWLKQYISETELAERLLKVQGNWQDALFTGLFCFKKYFNDIPKEWKDEIIKNGLSLNMRDNLAVLEQKQKSKEDFPLCNAETKAWECKINDYNFRLVSSQAEFFRTKRHLSLFDDFKLEEILKNNASLFVIERSGRILRGILMYGKVVKRYYFKEILNKLSEAKLKIVFLHWLRIHDLEYLYTTAYNNALKSQEFFVEPVDKDEEYEKISLLELSAISEDSIRPGFYLYCYKKLSECNLMRPDAPTAKDDEYEYLSKNFKCGKIIYDAAFNGNAEAAYAMSLLYCDGVCVSSPNYCLSEKWYNKAVQNGWLEIAPCKKDVKILA